MDKSAQFVSYAALALASLAGTTARAQTPPDCATQPGACDSQSTGGTAASAKPKVAPTNANGDADGLITVTGSRIRLPASIANLEPTEVVTSQYINERAITNIADALNETPAIRGSITPNGAQGSFGQGVNFVNTFGLGSNRTLTLVNGRRFVSSNPPTLFNQGSPGTQVDLNVIPTALIDHTDIVSVGGAPIYGSDAIAGTVNVVLKEKFEGLQVDATSGVTSRGDGFHYDVTTVLGHNFLDDRLNVTVSYDRDRENGILQSQRAFYLDNVGTVTNPASAAAAAALVGRTAATGTNDGRINPNNGFGSPGSILIHNLAIPFLTGGGLITLNRNAAFGVVPGVSYSYQFDPSGNLVPFNRGIAFPGIYAYNADRNAFKFSDYGQVTSNLDRDIFNGFVTFKAAPAATLFFEGTYYYSRGDQLVRQPTFNSNLFGGSSGALTFNINNPFLTPQAKAQLTALGVQNFQISRASSDLADLSGATTYHLYRGVLGVRGDFTLFGGRKFNYEVSGNYGRNDLYDYSQDLNRQNFINATNVTTDANGNIVCTTATTNPLTGYTAPGGTPVADPNCVPLNLLGYGRASQAARNYVIANNVTQSTIEEFVVNANVGGSPFSLFHNDVGFNVGVEHRHEQASFTPSAFQQQGLGRSAAVAPLSGGYTVNEAFGELALPLLTPANGVRFINSLELFARGRYTDNSVNGGFAAYALGGRIAPVPDIQFRGNYTRSFRQPAVTELYLPISPGFSFVPDLCSPGNIGQGPAPATRTANCTAFLAKYPNATPLLASQASVPSLSGGNPLLKNEIASSFTYGVVFKPRFLPHFLASIDYIDINITNPIAQLSVATIASACFDNTNFNKADPANGNAFCSLIKRDATGQVISDAANPGVTSQYINGNRIYFSGIQGGFDWFEMVPGDSARSGRIELDSTMLYVRRRLVDLTGVAPTRTDGTFGDPKFQAQVNMRYYNDDYGVTVSANVVGRQLLSRTPSTSEIQVLKPYAEWNVSTYFNVKKMFRLTLAVTNLFDRIGQSYYGYIIPASYSDVFGRRYAVSISAKF